MVRGDTLGAERGHIGVAQIIRVWSLPSRQLLGDFGLDGAQRAVLPAILSFEAGKRQTILEISSYLPRDVSHESGVNRQRGQTDLGNFDPSHDLLGHLCGGTVLLLSLMHGCGLEQVGARSQHGALLATSTWTHPTASRYARCQTTSLGEEGIESVICAKAVCPRSHSRESTEECGCQSRSAQERVHY